MAEIETTGSWPDAKSFSTTCDCGSHSLSIWIEKEYKELYLMLESRVGSWEDDSQPRYKVYWNRIKRACSLLFLGYIEQKESFTFRSENHIKEFLETIIKARNELTEDSAGWTLKEIFGPKTLTDDIIKDNIHRLRAYLNSTQDMVIPDVIQSSNLSKNFDRQTSPTLDELVIENEQDWKNQRKF